MYVEANYELREADPAAEPDSSAAQRQIFLRHGEFFAKLRMHRTQLSAQRPSVCLSGLAAPSLRNLSCPLFSLVVFYGDYYHLNSQ